MAACGMEVAGLEVEADIPATTMPRDCREQNPRPRRANPAIGADIAGLARAQQSSQLPSVVVHPDLSDGRQSNRPGMAFADPDQATAMLMPLVAYPEALAAATFAFVLRESNPRALACAAPGISKCGKRPTAVNRGFLKHLCRDPTPPGQPGHLLVDDSARRHDEQPAGVFADLPSIERVNQVESRPRHPDLRVDLLGIQSLTDQVEALVLGEPGCPRVPGKLRLLRGGWVECEPERVRRIPGKPTRPGRQTRTRVRVTIAVATSVQRSPECGRLKAPATHAWPDDRLPTGKNLPNAQ